MKKLGNRVVRAALIAAGTAVFMGPVAAADYQGTGDDYAQISNTLRVYSWGMDYRDGPMWASAFMPNGEFHDQSLCLIGRAQISQYITDRQALVKSGNSKPTPPQTTPATPSATPFVPVSHHIVEMGPVTFQDHDHATMLSTGQVVGDVSRDQKTNEGIRVTFAYVDKLERLGGKWLFSKRMQHSPGDTPPWPCPGK